MRARPLQPVLTVGDMPVPAILEAQGWGLRSSGGTPSHSAYGHSWVCWESHHQPLPLPSSTTGPELAHLRPMTILCWTREGTSQPLYSHLWPKLVETINPH